MVRTKNHAQKHTPLKRHWVSATGRLHTQQSTANTHTKGPLEKAHEKGHKRHQNPQTQHTSNGPAWDIGRSGMRRTVQRDQPDGPALNWPRGQRHSPAPGLKRRTVRRRAPDGPTNVGQQGPSTAKQALTQTQASDGPVCDAGRSVVWCWTVRHASDGPAYYAGRYGVYENARPSPRQPSGKTKSNHTSRNEPQSSPNHEDTE